MDQTPPARKNTFVIVAAVLFNLLWITLLFLSCQADNGSKPTPTPEAGIEEHMVWDIVEALSLGADAQKDAQTLGMVDRVSVEVFNLSNYSVPLYKPPSTCSMAPVI